MLHNYASKKTIWEKIVYIIKPEKGELYAIYFYAILYGTIQLSLPLFIQSIINFATAQRFSTSLWILIVSFIISVFVSGILQMNQLKIIEKIQQQIFVRYSVNFATHIPSIDIKAIDKQHLPEIVNRFFDVVILQKGLNKLMVDIPIATIQILFGVILLSFYNSIFIGFGFALILLLALIIGFTARTGFESSIRESDFKYRVEAWLEEMARILPTFKFNKSNNFHLKKTDEETTGYLHARTKHFKILLSQYWSLIIFKVIITGSMLILGVVLLVDNKINIGQFVAAEIVILLVLNSVEKFILNLDSVYDVLTSVEKLNNILEKPIEKNGTLVYNNSENAPNLELQNLSIGFNDSGNIIDNLNLSIKSGQVACISGDSGKGKSLILKLFTGIYSDFSGKVLVNQLPIHNYDLASLHNVSGIKLNTIEIFPGTIFENIVVGNKNISTDEVTDLAQKLGFSNLFQKFKNGLNEQLLFEGRQLSKLERNQLLLLRALVGSPQILLLEEPFQGMDEENAKILENYLLNENKATTIVVSARKAFAEKCDVQVNL